MREAFLIQMNDFDRMLESGLRQLLDPVANAPAPPRRRPAYVERAGGAPTVELTLAPETLAAVPIEVYG